MAILLVFLFFLFPSSTFSAPKVTINQLPDPVIIGDSFTVPFTVTNNDIGNTYHYKVVGVGLTLVNLPDDACDNRYDSCPVFSIGGSESVQFSAIAKIIEGTGQIKIRIAQADDHDKPSDKDSDPVAVNLLAPTPTQTPTPTSTPTATPTPDPTPDIPTPTTNTPTLTPTKTPTPTHTPTPTPTPKPPTNTPTIKPPTSTPTLKPTPTNNPLDLPTIIETEDAALYLITPSPADSGVLGIQNFVAPTATPSSKIKLPKNLLPSVFIGVGSALLLTPLVLSKLKRGQN